MGTLTDYIDAWVANDPGRITAAVTEHCVITESATDLSITDVTEWRQWAEMWFAPRAVLFIAGRSLTTSLRRIGGCTVDLRVHVARRAGNL